MSKKLRPWFFLSAGLIVLSIAFYALQMPNKSGHVFAEENSEVEVRNSAPASGVEELIEPRVMGDTTAPIRIEEFASLSCSHCADFHLKVLPDIKKNYIDTGKAYLVFNDFPLNASALHGSMTARCVPETRYFDFIKLLFEKQTDWAFKENFGQILGQYASLLGLGKDAYESCLKNEDLQKGLIANVSAAQEKWKISSTPSFVINDSDVVSGAQAYKTFEEKFEAILKSQNPTE